MKMRVMIATMAAAAGSAMAQPANDTCTGAEVVSGFGTFSYDNNGAATDGPGTSCGGLNAYNDVWFSWTASANGNVKAELCAANPGFDTVIVVYQGNDCSGFEIACNDDSCGLLSSTNWTAVAGETYTIRIGAYGDGAFGAGSLTIGAYIPGVVVGPVVSPINGHTYYLLEASSWTDGEINAQALGGHLATIRSDDENIWVVENVLRPEGAIRRGWIGLNDQAIFNEYVWTSGEPVNYTNWSGGEPNHANGTEFFAQIPWWAYSWNDNSDFPSDDPCYPIVEVITEPGCPADFNGDDFLDFFDYADYVACFEDGTCPAGRDADFNGDDFVDFFDYSDFVTAFEAGC